MLELTNYKKMHPSEETAAKTGAQTYNGDEDPKPVAQKQQHMAVGPVRRRIKMF